MTDPFTLHDDDINDRALEETESKLWTEKVAPSESSEIEYLKPALRKKRARYVLIACLAILFLFLARSADLQIIHHGQYKAAAEHNRVRQIRIQAPRGIIIDRTGEELTRNLPRFRLILNPLDLPQNKQQRKQVLNKIATLANIPFETLSKESSIAILPVKPLIIQTNLTLDEIYPLVLATQNIAGVSLEVTSAREYTKGHAFAHVLGYVGKIEQDKIDYYLASGYGLDALVGKSGLEAAFEKYLHGVDGRKYIEVDATGKIQNTVALEQAVPGKILQITIDSSLQEKAAQALQKGLQRSNAHRGAVVVLDPQNGEILALVSLPDFDNNIFTIKKNVQEEIQALFTDPNHPLFPRVIAGTYPSGSTIKPAIAAIALDQGVITRFTSYLSVGGLRIKQWFFPDWRASGHGLTNVRHALADSVNTFFYIIGGGYKGIEGLGIERLSDGLKKFDFAQPTGIEIRGEASGLVPTPEWKIAEKGERWYVGDTYHLAIGQGDILVTPLQIARMTAYFASAGEWIKPHIVKSEIKNQDIGPEINLEHVQTVRQGMRDAVRYGSARSLQALPVTSAGKTGTAQWSSKNPSHAWFTGWAPYNDAEIVITVLIEEGGEGASFATPVAKEIMNWWHQNLYTP